MSAPDIDYIQSKIDELNTLSESVAKLDNPVYSLLQIQRFITDIYNKGYKDCDKQYQELANKN